MRKEKKLQILIIVIMSIVVAGMSIGFAAYSQSLSITSTMNVQPSVWKVKFDTESTTGCNEASGTGTISNVSLEDSTISFDADLNQIGDYVEYNACIINSGTIDAELTSIIMPSLTEAQKKYIKIDYGYGDYPQSSLEESDFILHYSNQENTIYNLDSPLALLAETGKHTFRIRMEYIQPEEAEDLPSTQETINIATTLNYDQI